MAAISHQGALPVLDSRIMPSTTAAVRNNCSECSMPVKIRAIRFVAGINRSRVIPNRRSPCGISLSSKTNRQILAYTANAASAAAMLMSSGSASPAAEAANGASRKGHKMLEDGADASARFTP